MLSWKEIKQDNPSIFLDTLELPELGQTIVRIVSKSTQYDNKIESINEFVVPSKTSAKSEKAKPASPGRPKKTDAKVVDAIKKAPGF